MKLDIPFYKNEGDGNQCMQVAMQSVIKHFLNKEYSREELDKLTGRKPNLWTWTPQVVPVLYDIGLNLRFYSKTDLKPLLEGEIFIKEHFGKDADKILKFTDVTVLVESVKKLLEYDLFERKILSPEEIELHIEKCHALIFIIDNNKITDAEKLYQGHYVVMTGFDEENVFYHDSGPVNPEADKKIPKTTFMEAWNANGTDNDVIVIHGKRD
jgi:hypothetical protein